MATGSFAFGGAAPAFTIEEILLYCLQVTVSTGACSYTSSSGSYTGYSSIATFISALEAGTLPPPGPLPLFGPGDTPPDLLVTMPGYIVIMVSSTDQPTLCFQSTPMTTSTDCSSRYFALTELPYGASVNPVIAYFAVPVVAPANLHVADPYTMYLQYTAGSSTLPYDIDPCVKNRGSK